MEVEIWSDIACPWCYVGKRRFGFGIMSVPTFVIDRAMGAAGAQPAEVMLSFLRRGWDKRPRAAIVAESEES